VGDCLSEDLHTALWRDRVAHQITSFAGGHVSKAIVGPVLADLSELWGGRHFVLASAFYSAARLNATTITTRSAQLLVRLDLERPDEWIARAVAPDALLAFVDRHTNVDIGMYCGPRELILRRERELHRPRSLRISC
jgi:hypothetical protein